MIISWDNWDQRMPDNIFKSKYSERIRSFEILTKEQREREREEVTRHLFQFEKYELVNK